MIKQRFLVLDIFRGMCAWIIVLFHTTVFSSIGLLDNPFVMHGNVFVDFFFVLSGFVIAYGYESLRQDQMNSFVSKRLARMYPLHFILLFVFIFIEVLKTVLINYIHVNQPENPNNNLFSFFSNLLLLNSIKVPGVEDVSWNIPSWSVSAEMIAYLVFAFVTIVVNKTKWSGKKMLIYVTIIIIASVILISVSGGFRLLYTFDFGFLRGIIGFFTGTACFQIYSRFGSDIRKLPDRFFHIMEVFVIVVIILLVCGGDLFLEFGYIYEPAFLLAILIFSFEKGIISAGLKKSNFLKNSATYSYSIYMTHALTLSIFNIIFIRLLKFPDSSYWYLLVFNLYLVFQTSKWSYVYIETFFKSYFIRRIDYQLNKN